MQARRITCLILDLKKYYRCGDKFYYELQNHTKKFKIHDLHKIIITKRFIDDIPIYFIWSATNVKFKFY